ncbi:hypothetical protein K6Y31_20510 [Motilimonas cestriensis]|uniref:Uncharacterized protein n=1 Tax=Motilimonas cestriensis TaxID=2742685 RepID=A0ABS8WF91_9GAMM|nr:hypothetical protein [Motilimonas cestriensis]MCE2597160.1 hypothetical protein [Motilimonas cestriensis]
MELIVIRKLIAGIFALLLATGVIKWRFASEHAWFRILLYIGGFGLLAAAAMYQFDIIPESSRDVLLK